jgi:hypothetical protein
MLNHTVHHCFEIFLRNDNYYYNYFQNSIFFPYLIHFNNFCLSWTWSIHHLYYFYTTMISYSNSLGGWIWLSLIINQNAKISIQVAKNNDTNSCLAHKPIITIYMGIKMILVDSSSKQKIERNLQFEQVGVK